MSDGVVAIEIRRILREEHTSARNVVSDDSDRRGSAGEAQLSLAEAAKPTGVCLLDQQLLSYWLQPEVSTWEARRPRT